MYDPMTVAFEIRVPWPWPRSSWKSKGKDGVERKRKGSRPSIMTIWHVDPEKDGSDDSCGWSRPKLTRDQRSNLSFLGSCEMRDPWFQRETTKLPSSPADAEALLRGALIATARSLRIKLGWEEVSELASDLMHGPVDNLRGSFCHLPGWHTNFAEDTESDRKDCAERFFWNLGGLLLARRRPWWKKPRWHFWHWSFQIHFIQNLKRWLFSRCARCGKRFTWGYAPISHQWHGGGPRWFKSEENKYHHECSKGGHLAKETEEFHEAIERKT